MSKSDKYITSCPRNCYSNCSMIVEVEEGIVKSILPHTSHKVTPEGPCLKGQSYLERVYSEKRIIKPKLKHNGKFVDITTDEALDIAADKIKSTANNYGSESIFFYSASGMQGLTNSIANKFWKKVGGVSSTYGNLCWPAGLEAVRLTLGEAKHNAPWDLVNSKLIILWGKNPAETNIHQMVFINQAIENGAKLVTIDPRATESCYNADLLIQPVPGTDGLLSLALAKKIIDEGSYDRIFVNKYVNGFDEFRKSLEDFSIVDALNNCGVKYDLFEELYNYLIYIKPITIVPGYGLQRYSNGGQTIRAILALSVITGNIGIKGGCFHYADLQSDIFSHKKEPISYRPTEKNDFKRVIPIYKLADELGELRDPPIKFFWCERGNPLTQNPNTNKLRSVFNNIDFKIVVEQFMTDTAQESDLIFPAKSFLEQTDIVLSYWHPFIHLRKKIINSPRDVLPETELYRLLANKLKIDNDFPELDKIENWIENNFLKPLNIKIDDLKGNNFLPPNYEEIPFANGKFNTISGKIELYSVDAEKLWGVSELPSYKTITVKPEPNEFYILTPNTKDRIHSQFGNLNIIKSVSDEPFVEISKIDAMNLKIKDNDMVEIYNDRGSLKLKCKISNNIRPRVISIYNGYWSQENANPNHLSKCLETDMGFGAAFHDNKVLLRKV